MRKILYVIISFCFVSVNAQTTISQSVINAGGRTASATINSQPIIYTDNIGETIIGTGTASGNILTQGFLQPDMVAVKNMSFTLFKSDVTCNDKRDGFLRVDITNPKPGATFYYYWNPDALCPSHNCSRIDSLSAGTFTVMVKWKYTVGTQTVYDSLPAPLVGTIKDELGLCDLKIFNGIKLNSSNGKFTIENIELYPDAKVSIYTRWGVKLFGPEKYNNSDNYWPRKDEKVLAGTYYYIIDAGHKGVRKSWLEVFD